MGPGRYFRVLADEPDHAKLADGYTVDDVLSAAANLVALATQVFFASTFLIVGARALRERRRASVDVALFLGVMTVLESGTRAAATAGVPPKTLTLGVEALILLLPYLMLRLVADFAAVPSSTTRAAEVALAALVGAFVLFEGIPPPLLAVAATAYVVAPFGWSALAFARQARSARGVNRRRYAAAVVGSALIAVGVPALGLPVAVSALSDASIARLVAELIGLGAGAAYFVGFATPLWLRRLWQEPELRSFLMRAPRLAASPDTDTLLGELAQAARSALGCEGVLIGVPTGTGSLRFVGTGPGYEAPIDETFAGRAMRAGRAIASFDPIRDVPARASLYRERGVKLLVAAPIRADGEILGALTARSSHASIFAEDDLRLCQLLADQAAVLMKHRALLEEREHLADHDALTRLPNSRSLHRRLVAAIAAAAERGRPLSLVLVEMDDAGEVDRTFGHALGDQVRLRVAERLAPLAPPPRLLARWRGDAFAVLLPDEGRDAAERAGTEVLAAFERPFSAADEAIELGARVGVAIFPDHGSDARGIEAAAEMAIDSAERTGSPYALSPSEIRPHGGGHLALRADLRRAITAGGLALAYQPLVAMSSGEVVRFEALVRWDHPHRGRVPPDEFVFLAERTGLIRQLTDLVLQRALSDVSAWRRALPRLRVAVNISARAFADAALLDRIRAATARAGCDPTALSVEITEGILMTEPERATHTIARLRDAGVTVEIDDFGTGYSSLAYLQKLPVDGVKIDRQFVVAMAAEERSDAIVRAAIRLSHELGFQVIAEGIEERRQWEILAAGGCDIAQGYYVARPMPADEVAAWIGSWERRLRSQRIAPQLPARGAAGRGPLVLVVDDDPAVLSITRDVLREHGYAVATASNGQEALARVGRERPSAVLLDVHMPLLDGPAFARILRERGVAVPLVVTTSGPNARRWAERLDADGHVAKPFAMDQLLSVVDGVVARAHAADQQRADRDPSFSGPRRLGRGVAPEDVGSSPRTTSSASGRLSRPIGEARNAAAPLRCSSVRRE